jgi:two-component system sensor histidine kinase QseC
LRPALKSSIRKFLLINLLLAITITTTLTAIGNYYLDQKDIQEHLDTLMAVSALSYQSLLGDDIEDRPLEKIQTSLKAIPYQIEHFYEKKMVNENPLSSLADRFSFQVWTKGGKLLLHSSSAPKIPLTADNDGFSDKTINSQRWRVFTTYNDNAGVNTVLAERYDTRNELGHQIAQDDLYIMLLTFPLSGLLIWLIIGKGLDSLDRVAKEVANRAPSHLEPVSIQEVPDEIKPVIDEINHLFNRLKEGFEREKRFAGDAAHELRTPLAVIKAQAQVALNARTLEEKNEALHKLIASVNRSAHVVQQLLTMSKITPETGQLNDISDVNIIKIARETLAMLAPSAIEKYIDLEFIYQDENIFIRGNHTALGILIRNLVDNAIRYSNPHGEVIVKIFQDPYCTILQVEDNGPGIPDELKARVFERFFRVLGHTSTGSGLGLSIVQQICDLHGAKIHLDTPQKHTGLMIRITFPALSSHTNLS